MRLFRFGHKVSVLVLLFGFFSAHAQTPPAAATKAPDEDQPQFGNLKTVVVDPNGPDPTKDPETEDLTRLDLPSGMKVDAMGLEDDQRNGVRREFLQVQWRPEDPIDLHVITPVGVKKPPVILYLYSYPSTLASYNDLEFCKFLAQNGFAAVGFVSALTGPRFHDRGTKEWFVSELPISLTESVHDVQMVLNYLASRGDLDMNRVGMWGDGSGASIAIMAAAIDPRIKVLDLLNPWGDWPEWLAKSPLVPENERPSYLKPDFLKGVENLDPVKWLPQLKTRQVRLQYMEHGVAVTPDAARQRLLKVAPPGVKLVRYENTKEFVTKVGSTGKGFDWIKEQLASMPPARGTSTSSVAESTTSTRMKDHGR